MNNQVMPDKFTYLHQIIRLNNQINNLNKLYEKKFGLSLVQWVVIGILKDVPGISAFELARKVGVHPSTLTQSLKRIRAKNFININLNPQDNRQKLISISKEGFNAYQQLEEELSGFIGNLAMLKDEIEAIRALFH